MAGSKSSKSADDEAANIPGQHKSAFMAFLGQLASFSGDLRFARFRFVLFKLLTETLFLKYHDCADVFAQRYIDVGVFLALVRLPGTVSTNGHG